MRGDGELKTEVRVKEGEEGGEGGEARPRADEVVAVFENARARGCGARWAGGCGNEEITGS
jgi:hypothetical protein